MNIQNVNIVLNNDLVFYLSDFLSYRDFFNLFSTCKLINNIIKNNNNRYSIKREVKCNEKYLKKYKIIYYLTNDNNNLPKKYLN